MKSVTLLTMHRRYRTNVLLSISFLGIGGVLGCRSDTTGPAPLDPANLYFQLTLNHHAITMALTAPYNTLQLMVTPQSATGALLVDTGKTTYTVSIENDDCGCQSVTVSPTGLLTAESADHNVVVIASHTIGNVTQTDTAVVYVNDVSPVPTFTTFTLQTQPGDSAKFSVSGTVINGPQDEPGLIPRVLDVTGEPIPDVVFLVSSPQDPCLTNCFNPIFFYNNLGFSLLGINQRERVLITAEATVYGVRKVDSLVYTVGWPLADVVYILPKTPPGSLTPVGFFGSGDDTVAVGATVVWVNRLTGKPADVVFDDPTAVQGVDSIQFANGFFKAQYTIPSEAGGNIAAFAVDSGAVTSIDHNNLNCLLFDVCESQTDTVPVVHARRFPTVGTYRYHSALYGTTGVLHVLPQFQFP